ncbi:MAG: AbrB/MazE/SpoVT family DNA-binding domain-containing protein [Thaumarchaeota archaeon]|nr:AbrB/MazE/SpoVT family DNA-binding domain-containing protein [Nitrososphaerota archaeon]
MSLDFTRLSEKGQVVIPNEMRKRMKLKEGTRFVILGLDDTLVLRKLELSQERLRLKSLLAKSREKARKVGFSQKEIDRLIAASRKVTA